MGSRDFYGLPLVKCDMGRYFTSLPFCFDPLCVLTPLHKRESPISTFPHLRQTNSTLYVNGLKPAVAGSHRESPLTEQGFTQSKGSNKTTYSEGVLRHPLLILFIFQRD